MSFLSGYKEVGIYGRMGRLEVGGCPGRVGSSGAKENASLVAKGQNNNMVWARRLKRILVSQE